MLEIKWLRNKIRIKIFELQIILILKIFIPGHKKSKKLGNPTYKTHRHPAKTLEKEEPAPSNTTRA